MIIRDDAEQDLKEIASLFFEAVHTIPDSDYSSEERKAWAPKNARVPFEQHFQKAFASHIAYVAEDHGAIDGFCDMAQDGYLDYLYVRSTRQKLCFSRRARSGHFETQITADASITAKSFFEKRGYCVLHSQNAEREGVKLTNFKMIKSI
ncbi:GNAT family N-acetyltransferase [Bacillus sp. FJAT-42376]|uniref:GNAT family N-acetyltransferase n=1 Tax=Bacillus sp. FJAT-42376 TaxID=2014076 RepID=UPI000F4F20D2|nr:GNAT family N-acetyltransferase [Bacillus sp. FJAT-42376]AZB41360.1 GNAT family N-acetyltransferase [Bacillus sp. FJAT-42376]